MAVIKVGPNKWKIRVSIRVKGKRHPIKRELTFTGTKMEAQSKQTELIESFKVTGSLTSQVKTFDQAVDIFTEKRGPFSKSHGQKVEFLKKELGHMSLSEFAERYENYIRILKRSNTQYGRPRSNHSINRYTEIVRAVFGTLVYLEYIDKNPITKLRFPKLPEKPRDRYLTHDERIKLLNAISQHRDYILPIVQYMLLVPCRKGELIEARKEQYNAFNQTIYIPDSKADIPIYKPVPAEMRTYFDSIPVECEWLFFRRLKKDGSYHKLGTLQKPWSYCVKKAGLSNVRIHDLRHISATDLYEVGNEERVIMDIAGWKTPMLSNYRHKDSFRSAKKIKFACEGNTQATTTVVKEGVS